MLIEDMVLSFLENIRTKWFLLWSDVLLFFLSVLLAWYTRFSWDGNPSRALSEKIFWIMLLLLLASNYVFGTYDLQPSRRFIRYMSFQTASAVSVFLILVAINYFFFLDRSGLLGRGVLLGSIGLYWVLSCGLRYSVKRYISHKWNRLRGLFIYAMEPNKRLIKDLQSKELDQQVEFLKIEDTDFGRTQLKVKLYEKWSFIVVPTHEFSEVTQKIIMRAKFDGVEIWDTSYFYERFFLKLPIELIKPNWFLLSSGFDIFTNIFKLRIKRLADITLALSLLIISLPIMFLTAVMISLESRGPVIYKQTRTGLRGKDFKIFKFRSMRMDAEKAGAQWASKNDSRVTKVGRFIRLTRIDELPQLWNVLKGEMSFVGPRPERPEFNIDLEKQIPFYGLRHLVRPGITGWAQIMYPYGASIEDAKEKLQYDLYYIKNNSFIMDMRIVMKTISVVILGKGL